MPSSPQTSSRLVFIDVARSLAIVSVLLAHALQALGGFAMMGVQGEQSVRLVTRNALPLFVFMFGMMLELVYRKRWQVGGGSEPSGRLIRRSLQCYLGYLVTILAGLLAGVAGPKLSLKAALLLANAEFGNILRFYAIALILAIPLLALRIRFGRGVLVALLAVIWASYPLIESLQLPRSSVVSFPFGMLLGPVGHSVGPSVFQGLTFVLAGMLCGSGLSNWREVGLKPFRRMTALVVTVAAIPCIYLISQSSVSEVYAAFTGLEWRRLNHPGYYSVGVMNCGLILLVLSFLYPPGRRISVWTERMLSFGRSSLTAFTVGNVILIFLMGHVAPTSTIFMAVAILFFLMTVWIVLLIKQHYWDPQALSE